MVSSYVALGYKCDHNCMNCPLSTYDRLHGQLDEKILMKHIEELSKNKDELNITLSGGEPTMNPHFFEVLEILGKANAYINILSTATRCKDKEFVDRIIKSLGEGYDFRRLNYISALHSSNQAIHDKLTGKEGSQLETLKGLENFDFPTVFSFNDGNDVNIAYIRITNASDGSPRIFILAANSGSDSVEALRDRCKRLLNSNRIFQDL